MLHKIESYFSFVIIYVFRYLKTLNSYLSHRIIDISHTEEIFLHLRELKLDKKFEIIEQDLIYVSPARIKKNQDYRIKLRYHLI